ncbi:MAG: MBL fold metallo-hydrolase [Chloroflexales bacterium]|nr:MBL fold metallo-hydrolase [Chloroflexales bacterium]
MALIDPVTATVVRVPLGYVNAYLVGNSTAWVLVDTGERTHAGRIRAAARSIAGDRPPQAIVLTHGHFDHAGSAAELSRYWSVPIYASRYELPFLQGDAAYPPPDPSVGGFYGWLAHFVTMPVCDLQADVRALPADLAAVGLDGWTCVATPGHTPGHLSFFHLEQGVLLAGDACLTIDFQSWIGSLTSWQRVSAPPAPYTLDWAAAHKSVQALAMLRPQIIASGHGKPMRGARAARGLAQLAQRFTPPKRGRWVGNPLLWPTPRPGDTPCTQPYSVSERYWH